MKDDLSGVFRKNGCKIFDLVFCSLGCIRMAVVIRRMDLDSSFRHQKPCNWRVDTAREHKHGAAVDAVRHSADSFFLGNIDVSHVADFDLHSMVRILDGFS